MQGDPAVGHGEGKVDAEGGGETDVGGDAEEEAVGRLGDQVFLGEELEAVGHAFAASRTARRLASGPRRSCMRAETLRSNQFEAAATVTARVTQQHDVYQGGEAITEPSPGLWKEGYEVFGHRRILL